MATTIKLIRETKVECEKYFIYENDWCKAVITINNDDAPEVKEEKFQNALKTYKELKDNLLNPTLIETLLEDTI